jgi:hypothetical protein
MTAGSVKGTTQLALIATAWSMEAVRWIDAAFVEGATHVPIARES